MQQVSLQFKEPSHNLHFLVVGFSLKCRSIIQLFNLTLKQHTIQTQLSCNLPTLHHETCKFRHQWSDNTHAKTEQHLGKRMVLASMRVTISCPTKEIWGIKDRAESLQEDHKQGNQGDPIISSMLTSARYSAIHSYNAAATFCCNSWLTQTLLLTQSTTT